MFHRTDGICVYDAPHEMLEYDQVRPHDWELLSHILDIYLVPSNDTYDAISTDIDYLTTIRRLCTFHFCFLPFLHVSVDLLNDAPEYAFEGDSSEGNPGHRCHIRFGHQLCFHSESIVHDHRVFPMIKTCVNKNREFFVQRTTPS